MDFIFNNAPIIGLIFFISIFCVVLFVALRPKNKKKFQDYSKIPLKDE